MNKYIRLFRQIIREHRKFPTDMRIIGNSYVKNEFKENQGAKPEQLESFYDSWNDYLDMIRKQNDTVDFGRHMSEDELKHLTPQQRDKLQEIKLEVNSDGK